MNNFVEIMNIITTAIVVILSFIEHFYRKLFPFKKKSLNGKCVLITGGGGGLGKQLAVNFAKCGARIILWDIHTESNESTASLLKAMRCEAFSYTCDCGNEAQVKETALKVQNEIGHIDVLVNNAGIMNAKSITMQTEEQIRKTFDTNVLSHFWTTKAFLPSMMERNDGHIVTIASTAAINGSPYLCDYSASKYALIGYHESLTLELREQGFNNIRTTCICPNFINTGLSVKPKTNVPWLIPILQASEVAKAIVNAVRTNQDMLILPKIFYAITIKRLIPFSAQLAIHDYLGIGIEPKSTKRTKKITT
ncbi:estradiol 17-beta-dehydrogenase 11 isoform X2 [Hydra vulgaris]|uniref:Estradiol 17-beta-dehydrogenase 11 isoform X2 n=1 Tax=Hydra vulgaris TaxID=6087 RepID=A0ABM4BS94_HYDVU